MSLYRVKNLLAGAACLLLAVLGGNCLGVGLCGLFVLPWAPVVNGRAALPLVLTGLALTAAMALPAQAFRPRYRLPLFAAGVGTAGRCGAASAAKAGNGILKKKSVGCRASGAFFCGGRGCLR